MVDGNMVCCSSRHTDLACSMVFQGAFVFLGRSYCCLGIRCVGLFVQVFVPVWCPCHVCSLLLIGFGSPL